MTQLGRTNMHDYIPILSGAIWPATVLIIVIYFRGAIRARIESVTEAKIGSSVLKFGLAKTDAVSLKSLSEAKVIPGQLSEHSRVKWDHVANLFWLGSDLQYTAQI